MSERQATLHDDDKRVLAAQVVDLRARLATAEAERDAALKDAARWKESARYWHAQRDDLRDAIKTRDAAQDGKP